jgi:hypothetical protein
MREICLSGSMSRFTTPSSGLALQTAYVALPKQICVIADPSAISPYPGHFWFVRRGAHRHTEHDDHNAE